MTKFFLMKLSIIGTSLVVQWLWLCTCTAGGMGSIPGQRTKILHATGVAKKKKETQYHSNYPVFYLPFPCFFNFFSFYDKILLKVYKMSIVPPKRYYFYGTRKHFSNLNLIKPQILATFFSQIVKITFYLLFVFNINLFILIGG